MISERRAKIEAALEMAQNVLEDLRNDKVTGYTRSDVSLIVRELQSVLEMPKFPLGSHGPGYDKTTLTPTVRIIKAIIPDLT